MSKTRGRPVEALIRPERRLTPSASMPMTRLPDWVIADTHFGHDNIIRYSNRPQDHDALMIANWKSVIKNSDIVLHMGDVYFKNVEIVKRAHLSGQIYFLKGNHDRGAAISNLRSMGWKLIEPFFYQMGKWKVVFTHWPIDELGPLVLNVHGHTHTLPERSARYLSLSVERQDYRPQPLVDLLTERIKLLDSPDELAAYEKVRVVEWEAARVARERRESRGTRR